jgi:hypothetical protein
VLVNNNTTFEQYHNKVKNIISTHFQHGYSIDTVQHFKILI